MSRPQDIFGAAPLTVLNKPFMHVQDKRAVTLSGDVAIAGYTDRTLSDEITNSISGASLSANQITLPAGTYFISVFSAYAVQNAQRASVHFVTKLDNTVLLQGLAGASTYSTGSSAPSGVVSGQLTLAAQTTIKLRSYSTGTGYYGLPVNVTTEIFTDFLIWQLDATTRTPVLVNDSLYPLPGSTYVTGNMFGLEYAKTGANQVTVQPGICMDSTNNELITLSSATAKSIGTTINEIYNLFVCKAKSGGAISIETDTDVDGSSLSATYYFRWIGFVRNNGSGVVCSFVMNGDLMEWSIATENIITTIAVTTVANAVVVGHSSFIPESRIAEICYGVGFVASNGYLSSTFDNTYLEHNLGASTAGVLAEWGSYSSNLSDGELPYSANRKFFFTTSSCKLLCKRVTLKR